jgi:peptide/nickel transport system permease protein
MVFIVLGAAYVIFTILYFTPGDPARIILGGMATEDDVLSLRIAMGLEEPYIVQLGTFFKNFLRLDFGDSWTFRVPIFQELIHRLPRTFIIGISAIIMQILIGIPLGIFAATHQGKWQDSAAMIVAMVFISCPEFWIALMMIILFSLKLGLLPAYGIESWKCYILPVLASMLGGTALNARQTRSSMLEIFRADFITTARAKGQKESVVIRKHMLPNALMPILTHVGNGLVRVVAGSAIIESVFSIPGVGMYLLTGIQRRDYPIVRGCVLFLAVFAALSMLIVDLSYAQLDPRIKAQYSGEKRK